MSLRVDLDFTSAELKHVDECLENELICPLYARITISKLTTEYVVIGRGANHQWQSKSVMNI